MLVQLYTNDNNYFSWYAEMAEEDFAILQRAERDMGSLSHALARMDDDDPNKDTLARLIDKYSGGASVIDGPPRICVYE